MNYVKTGLLLAALMALFGVVGSTIGGTEGMIMALGLGLVMNLIAYWNSDKMVLRAYQAQEVDEQTAPEYYRIVQMLAQNAQLPMPKVYIINNPQPNAFATGRNPTNAAVAATTGLLNILTPRELAGVMAHELAHVKNHDTLTMTVSATIAGAISTLAQFGFLFGGRGSGENRPHPIAIIISMFIAPLAAMILQMAISRSREYVADRMGSEIAQDPHGLASALNKIAHGASHIPNYDAETHPATAPLFIINPLSGQGMDNWFATHPPTENRLAELHKLAQHMRHVKPLISEKSNFTAYEPEDSSSHTPPFNNRGPWG